MRIVGVVVFGLEAFDDDDDDDDRSCNSGKSMIFISLPTVDEHLDAAPSADYSILLATFDHRAAVSLTLCVLFLTTNKL